MKVICVGSGPCRCLVLRFRKANILLDCAAPLYSTLCAISTGYSPHGNTDTDIRVSDADGAAAAPSAPDGATKTPAVGCPSDQKSSSHSLRSGLVPSDEAAAGAQNPVRAGAPPPTTWMVSGSDGAGGNGNGYFPAMRDPVELTPFLPLLNTLELHAALISSPEALLALPHLVTGHQHRNGLQYSHSDTRHVGCADSNATGGRSTNPGEMRSLPGPAWHHIGPIRGPVYCTQAALDAAEQLVAEKLSAEEAVAVAAARTPLPPQRFPGSANLSLEPLTEVQEALLAACWRRRAPWSAVRYCLDRVRPVRYGQVVPLDAYELTAVAYPSGSGFGHAVWQIADGAERCRTVLYLPDVASTHSFAPPLPLELVTAPDVLILGPDCLSATPAAAPSAPPPRAPKQAMKEAVLQSVVAGGRVLIPVYATGEAWELLEALAGALACADLAAVPLLYIGPRSRTSLALASVSLESLAPDRQAAVYLPQHPFTFDRLMQEGRLVVATSLRDPAVQRCLQQQQPAVVLVAADSLLHLGGPALELLMQYGPNPKNLLLLTHAAPQAALYGIQRLYEYAAAAATATPAAVTVMEQTHHRPPPRLQIRVVHLPLRGNGVGGDASGCSPSAAASGPSPATMLDLIVRLQPRHLVVTHRDLRLLRLLQQQRHAQLQLQTGAASTGPSLPPLGRESVVPYAWLHQVRVALPRNVHSAVVAPELLQRLQWLQGGPGLQLARLNCLLVFRNGAWHADSVPGGATSTDTAAAAAALTAGGAVAADQLLLLAAAGRPALGPLLEALTGHGITRVSVTTERELTRLTLDDKDDYMLVGPKGAHVHSSCPVLRQIMTESLMKQLAVL